MDRRAWQATVLGQDLTTKRQQQQSAEVAAALPWADNAGELTRLSQRNHSCNSKCAPLACVFIRDPNGVQSRTGNFHYSHQGHLQLHSPYNTFLIGPQHYELFRSWVYRDQKKKKADKGHTVMELTFWRKGKQSKNGFRPCRYNKERLKGREQVVALQWVALRISGEVVWLETCLNWGISQGKGL